ncbi:MAG: hypothetical protein Unbinned1473contig1000_21 [Prokaryotic dsDNA virus sp.]|nr:MAG: hypothetical protein Unbinned1473contig1000_21 [Prokaryotic dsDNA virus sp.]|tara:strand:+ start:6609 stop:8093 length:1485 start_codon:yes stop_codon:yes gene_type:complete
MKPETIETPNGTVYAKESSLSNKLMYKNMCTIQSVVKMTEIKKIGRGKNILRREVLKHNVSKETVDIIDRSVEYYKEKMKGGVTFRDYQTDIINRGSDIIRKHGFVYLAMEVRTGKTLTSLGIAQELLVNNVLFVTKKKAISSIESDYDMLNPNFNIVVINYESLHKVDNVEGFDLVVLDEAHGMGAFPKPSKRAKDVKEILARSGALVIYLSGTPTPESYSQMYHQVYGVSTNPFKEFKNFYRFCDKYVNVKQRKINGMISNDYSDGMESIIEVMNPYMISYTQKEAGFTVKTKEHVIEIDMEDSTYKLANRLKRDLVIEGKEEVILADTPVKLMMKLHQIYSGTIKFESGNSKVLDYTKANFIKDNFGGMKIGVFYKFSEELNALKKVFGDDKITKELSVFNDTDCPIIALQILEGREGISLKNANVIVYYNIDFSATSYWQSKERMTTKERLESDVYWLFSRGGIEKDIYKAVNGKKSYTTRHFKRDHKIE